MLTANPDGANSMVAIEYYNTNRIQRKQHLMTPIEYHEHYHMAA